MAQSKEFVDASHALNDLSHALALLESENASLRGAVDGLCNENDRLRELVDDMWREVAAACMEQVTPHETLREFSDRMNELGVEVDK